MPAATIKVDPDELEDARWFPRGELPGLPSRHSISRLHHRPLRPLTGAAPLDRGGAGRAGL